MNNIENNITPGATYSFTVVTIPTMEFPPRVLVAPFWEIEAHAVMDLIAKTTSMHAEILGCGGLKTTIHEIAC